MCQGQGSAEVQIVREYDPVLGPCSGHDFRVLEERYGQALKIGKDQGCKVSVGVLATSSKEQAGIPGPLFIPDESAWPVSWWCHTRYHGTDIGTPRCPRFSLYRVPPSGISD